jgi:hypothetical protein
MNAGEKRGGAPSADLRARVLADVARTPAPTRREHRQRTLLVVGASVFATTLLFFAMGGVAPGARPIELVAFTAGLALVFAVTLTRLSSGPSRSMLGRPRRVLLLACIVVAPLLALVALVATAVWPEHTKPEVGGPIHVACGLVTLVQAALPLVALLAPRRGSDPVHPMVTGGALGMTAGTWAAMLAQLRCPHADAVHCIAAHVLPVLVLGAVGALLGRSFLAPRSR